MHRVLTLLLLLLAPLSALAGPHTVAVLYFHNEGNPELEPLKVGLAQMLITDLQGVEGVKVVERARLQAVLDELELGHSGVVAPDSASQVGRLLGAEWLVLGSYFELMGTLRIDTRLVDVETGEVLHAHGLGDSAAAFRQVEERLARELRQVLAARAGGEAARPAPRTGTRDRPGESGRDGEDGGGEATEVAAPDPRALEAAVAFSEGLIALDRRDADRARESFQRALEADPDLEQARAELAEMEI